MSTPDPRLSRRDAERLLDAPAEHDSVLGWALTAASAPAHPSELHGEDAAAAAFQAARLSPAPSTRIGYVSPSRLGSRAAARAVIATGAVVALTSGGFALASTTGLPGLPDLPGLPALPGQASDRASDATADAPRGAAGSVTPGDSGSADGSPSGSASGSPGASGSTGSSSSTASPGSPSATPSATSSATPSATPPETSDGPATPSPSFEGLCRAFQATDRSDAGSSLDSAAFLALAAQAGGADRIATYCVDLIGPPKQTAKPTPSPGKPTDQPTKGNQGNQSSGNNNAGSNNNSGNNSGNNSSGSQNNGSTNQPNPNSQSNNGNGNGNGPGKSGSSSNPSPATTPATPTSPASPTTSPTGPGSSGNPDKGGGAHTSG